eukprot:TRINITY_DN4266_c0_g4_i1.p1 TRINITY_DN4266_c0_g4~~TRINITY_DN4266_c0_g4_i1.p1  ORF type:complete len:479 (-),score=71.17 TRINITY_DN4266_c0_g4_i1:483-1919(-)
MRIRHCPRAVSTLATLVLVGGIRILDLDTDDGEAARQRRASASVTANSGREAIEDQPKSSGRLVKLSTPLLTKKPPVGAASRKARKAGVSSVNTTHTVQQKAAASGVKPTSTILSHAKPVGPAATKTTLVSSATAAKKAPTAARAVNSPKKSAFISYSKSVSEPTAGADSQPNSTGLAQVGKDASAVPAWAVSLPPAEAVKAPPAETSQSPPAGATTATPAEAVAAPAVANTSDAASRDSAASSWISDDSPSAKLQKGAAELPSTFMSFLRTIGKTFKEASDGAQGGVITDGCSADSTGFAIGCRVDKRCSCGMIETCYPHYGPLEPFGLSGMGDVGVCSLHVVILVVISVLLFITCFFSMVCLRRSAFLEACCCFPSDDSPQAGNYPPKPSRVAQHIRGDTPGASGGHPLAKIQSLGAAAAAVAASKRNSVGASANTKDPNGNSAKSPTGPPASRTPPDPETTPLGARDTHVKSASE